MFRAFLSNFITHILNLLLTLILPFSISPVYSLLSFTATTDLISSSLCLLAIYCSYPTHPCLFFLTPNHQPPWYQLSFRNTNLIITCKISTFLLITLKFTHIPKCGPLQNGLTQFYHYVSSFNISQWKNLNHLPKNLATWNFFHISGYFDILIQFE